MKRLVLLLLILAGPAYAQWNRKADLPSVGRGCAFAFSLNDKIYTGTGCKIDTSSSTYKNDLWQFDPVSNTWSSKANYPGLGRVLISSFSINGKGYAGLGSYKTGTITYRPNDFWMYDPLINTWTRKADFPGPARVQNVCFSIGSKAYIALGLGSVYYNDLWEYDTNTDTWTKKADFPDGMRIESVAFTINGFGYVGAGSDDSDLMHSDFWRYNPILDQWNAITSMPGTVKLRATAFAINNSIYVGTGWSYSTGKVTNNFWIYDPVFDSWTALADEVPCDVTNAYWTLHGAPSLAYQDGIWI
jgi:N-acetylneuraminic acid mutarotase